MGHSSIAGHREISVSGIAEAAAIIHQRIDTMNLHIVGSGRDRGISWKPLKIPTLIFL
jgi:hypothetical protein